MGKDSIICISLHLDIIRVIGASQTLTWSTTRANQRLPRFISDGWSSVGIHDENRNTNNRMFSFRQIYKSLRDWRSFTFPLFTLKGCGIIQINTYSWFMRPVMWRSATSPIVLHHWGSWPAREERAAVNHRLITESVSLTHQRQSPHDS